MAAFGPHSTLISCITPYSYKEMSNGKLLAKKSLHLGRHAGGGRGPRDGVRPEEGGAVRWELACGFAELSCMCAVASRGASSFHLCTQSSFMSPCFPSENRLRLQDVGLKTHLDQLDQQISELQLDVRRTSSEAPDSDSRPSSGMASTRALDHLSLTPGRGTARQG